MAKLKLGPIADDKPVKVTLELPASLHRDLTAYADLAVEAQVTATGATWLDRQALAREPALQAHGTQKLAHAGREGGFGPGE